MKKIIVAIDSFKGSLSSQEAGRAAMEGIKDVYPECEVLRFPIADGGEGALEVLVNATKGRYILLQAHNPLMEKIETCYGISGDGKTALIEMAAISGLPLIPENQRNPMITTSFGTGELIKDALERGCRNFIIGIGGSATNDAGLGMLQALGFRFLGKDGKELGYGGEVMGKVVRIDALFVHPALHESFFTIACDVHNPFYGQEGAAYVFGPQKGASPQMVKDLDKGMQSLAEIIKQITGKEIQDYPGAGAAGGMGGIFLAFLNAELKPGIELLLDIYKFEEKIRKADLIITGEGKVDKQTTMGKVPYGILQKAKLQDIPVLVIAGSVEDIDEMNAAGFRGVFSITPAPVDLEKAMQPAFTRENIRNLVSQLCRFSSSFIVKNDY